jgi:hypothetical protein
MGARSSEGVVYEGLYLSQECRYPQAFWGLKLHDVLV